MKNFLGPVDFLKTFLLEQTQFFYKADFKIVENNVGFDLAGPRWEKREERERDGSTDQKNLNF